MQDAIINSVLIGLGCCFLCALVQRAPILTPFWKLALQGFLFIGAVVMVLKQFHLFHGLH
jgi:hypothetical protein